MQLKVVQRLLKKRLNKYIIANLQISAPHFDAEIRRPNESCNHFIDIKTFAKNCTSRAYRHEAMAKLFESLKINLKSGSIALKSSLTIDDH